MINGIARATGKSVDDVVKMIRKGREMTPDERLERDKAFTSEALQKLTEDKIQAFYDASLWGQGRAQHFTLANWDITRQQNQEKARAIGNKAFVIAKQLKTSSFNVLLTGDVGSGKTALALSIMHEVNKTKTAMFVSVVEWKRMRLATVDKRVPIEKLDRLNAMMQHVDVLILDDLGKESKPMDRNGNGGATQDTNNMLFGLGDARMKKTTIVTTNDSQVELANKYDAAAISRLITKNPDRTISTKGLEDVRQV